MSKFRSIVHGVKRSFRKIFYTWSYYSPEIGLCNCLFKYAYYTYPVVPEVTHAVMGRARRMVSGFMNEFWRGYADRQQEDHHRISNKVAATTADDYVDYQYQSFPSVQPFRRLGEHANNLPQNVRLSQNVRLPHIEFKPNEKPDAVGIPASPLVSRVVDMLKNLQPKTVGVVANLARQVTSQSSATIIDDKEKETDVFNNDDVNEMPTVIKGMSVNPPPGYPQYKKLPTADYSFFKDGAYHHVHDLRYGKESGGEKVKSSPKALPRSFDRAPAPNPPFSAAQPQQPVDRVMYVHGTPPGLPKYDNLPPADYSYVKNGVHHHVHDLRKNKPEYPAAESKSGWLMADMEDTILQVMGLSNPGRAVEPSVFKCSKVYIFQKLLRIIQKFLFKH